MSTCFRAYVFTCLRAYAPFLSDLYKHAPFQKLFKAFNYPKSTSLVVECFRFANIQIKTITMYLNRTSMINDSVPVLPETPLYTNTSSNVGYVKSVAIMFVFLATLFVSCIIYAGVKIWCECCKTTSRRQYSTAMNLTQSKTQEQC